MLRTVKVRLDPDATQKEQLAKAFGSCRWVWNYFLNLMNETYKKTGRGLSGYDIKKMLKRKQQQLSRKQKGSNNRNQARRKVARVHNKVSRCREDFHHKLSRRIVNENQVICVENLNVKGMVRNHNLAKAINGVGWGQFCTMLKYKAENEGKVYLEVDRFFPSSKTCNNCLDRVRDLTLDVRHWQCPNCGTHHDRDINAAKNIRDEGLRILTTRSGEASKGLLPELSSGACTPRSPDRIAVLTCGTRDQAYRPDVRRDSRGRKKSTTTLSAG